MMLKTVVSHISMWPRWLLVLSFMMLGVSGVSGVSGVRASSLDVYKGTLSLRNDTGIPFLVTGCSADQNNWNRCFLTSNPVVVNPDTVQKIGEFKNNGDLASGLYAIHLQGQIAPYYQLHYLLDKHVVDSYFTLQNIESGGHVLHIDYNNCTRNPMADGVMRCCSFSKRHPYKMFREYSCDCELPITVVR